MKGGREGLGLDVLNRLSFKIKSLSTCNIVSKSVRLSFLLNTLGKVEDIPSADREGLPCLGEGAGELVLEETGEAVGVCPLDQKTSS